MLACYCTVISIFASILILKTIISLQLLSFVKDSFVGNRMAVVGVGKITRIFRP